MKKVKTHTFNGRKYKIDMLGPIDGASDLYKCNDRHLMICADPLTQAELITILHESLHVENWAQSEEIVDRVSTDIGKLLWRLGYRRKK